MLCARLILPNNTFSDYADINKVICMGNSGGGTATYYIACLEDRVKCAMPSCAVCSYDESIVSMRHCTCNFYSEYPHLFLIWATSADLSHRSILLSCRAKMTEFFSD
ncbi:MAG: hypothetical protein L6V93_06205 [Clostridiales bacterium]|nr:MAG: hypothetical protein L6V93_06205 [Clostridiales bacterium]